jgi:hypothetical protein
MTEGTATPSASASASEFEEAFDQDGRRTRADQVSRMRSRRVGLQLRGQEYREIRYTVRTRIERNEWTVSIHPAGIEGARRLVTGPRKRAELLARSMVDRWHERAAGKAVRSKEARRIAANIAKLPALVHQRNRRRALKGAI